MDINILAVLVSAVVAMGIGFLWYSEAVFGSAWVHLSDMSAEDIGNAKMGGMAKNYTLSTIAMIVMALVLAIAISYIGDGILIGLEVGFWAWLGFVAPVEITHVLYGKKPWRLYILETGYFLVSLLAMGAILGLWR